MFVKSWTELILAFPDTNQVLVLCLFNVAVCICLIKANFFNTKLWKTCNKGLFEAMFNFSILEILYFHKKRSKAHLNFSKQFPHSKQKIIKAKLFVFDSSKELLLFWMKTEICWKTVEVTSGNSGVKHLNCRVHDGSANIRDRSVYVCLHIYASPYVQLIKGKRSPFCSQITEDPNALVRDITWNTLLILKPPPKNPTVLPFEFVYLHHSEHLSWDCSSLCHGNNSTGLFCWSTEMVTSWKHWKCD